MAKAAAQAQSETFLAVDLTDQGRIQLPDTGEQRVRCKNAQKLVSDSGYERIFMVLEVADEPDMADFFHNLWLSNADDDTKRRKENTTALIETLEAFGVPYLETGFDIADLINRYAYGIVGHKDNAQSGKTEGVIKRWVTGAGMGEDEE